MKVKVRVAEYSGYCFGVKRALKITEETIKKYRSRNRKIFTLGSIIHNPGVTRELSKKGLVSVKDIDEIGKKGIFIIRSHGMFPNLINEIKAKKDVEVIDTTCPIVKKAQARARLLSKNGYFVVIIGNKNHPEVLGIKGYVLNEKFVVIEDEEDVEKLPFKKKIGVVVQTTQTKEKLHIINDRLLERTRELFINNTICDTTEKMQNSTAGMSKDVDIMLIVGGKNSANTKHLVEISRRFNSSTHHIENFKEIRADWFMHKSTAGISGGASTPVKDIKDVKKAIEQL
ncbi:MAG: 4-hydroxy-3-methylbut-2-enyl diphosphate reductase [Actinomycetota bacterium]|nr:4-hydroxy-3-methylbut-2-enyl diphosphate reductase [Actinomycetota bacterium]